MNTTANANVPSGANTHFLRQAIQLAVESLESGDQPYGSLLVDSLGTVLTCARNTTIRDRDLAAHPELSRSPNWHTDTLDHPNCGT